MKQESQLPGAMTFVRRAEQRGHTHRGWLDSYHTFSFAEYYDPEYTGFHSLRAINEDHLAAGVGFNANPRRNLEVITYVVSGALKHRDDLGHVSVVPAGGVQRLATGSGLAYSELNNSITEPVHFIQMWVRIRPESNGAPAEYSQGEFPTANHAALRLVCSPDRREGSLRINQDMDVYSGRLAPQETISYHLRPRRHCWVQVISGDLDIDGCRLGASDGAALERERDVPFVSENGAHFLLLDMR